MQRTQTDAMSQSTQYPRQSPGIMVGAFAGCCGILALLIGSFPIESSIVTVFLFAGIHNWMEFRYFVGRMPLRWGRSSRFYRIGIGGAVLLGVSYFVAFLGSGNWLWSNQEWSLFTSMWNSSLIVWIVILYSLRKPHCREKPEWWLALSFAGFAGVVVWLSPQLSSLALVYLHPFVAFWFLGKQIRRSKPALLLSYKWCMVVIPLSVIALALMLGKRPNLAEDTNLFWRITQHAGSQILPNISSHLLVAVHVFLETIHYFVWIIFIPLVDPRAIPWRMREIPLLVNPRGIPKLVGTVFLIGTLLVLILWIGFTIDYTTTRDFYFAVAILHVLAEFPFLIKML